MITYQVDENTDSKHFVETCQRQGLVDVWRCPRRLKGEPDPIVLGYVLQSGRTLLTNDRRIHLDNLVHVPERHCGILIITKTRSPTTIRIADVMRILSDFKSRFPAWHTTSLRNSIVEISENRVEVWRIDRGELASRVVDLNQGGWEHNLSTILNQNAERDAIESED